MLLSSPFGFYSTGRISACPGSWWEKLAEVAGIRILSWFSCSSSLFVCYESPHQEVLLRWGGHLEKEEQCQEMRIWVTLDRDLTQTPQAHCCGHCRSGWEAEGRILLFFQLWAEILHRLDTVLRMPSQQGSQLLAGTEPISLLIHCI